MKHQYIIIFVLSIAAIILVSILGSKTEIQSDYQNSEEQLIFRMVEHRSKEHPSYEGVQLFAKMVEERTDGKIIILIYDDQIGDESSIVEQISYGGIDFARVCGVYLDAYVADMNTLCMPGLYEDNKAMMEVFNHETVGASIRESLKNEKINVLTWYAGSTRGIFYNEDTLSDINEGKIAIPKSQMKILEMEAMDFKPIPYVQDNVNSYLEGGYVDGAEGELLDYYYHKSYHKAFHFTKTESRIPEVIVASNTAINQLTVEEQQIVIQAAYEAGLMTSELIIKKESEVQNELEDLNYVFDNIYKGKAYYEALDTIKEAIGDSELLEEISRILD